ncbi:MAG: hypothetical protein M1831_002788 [Alyxoria varia]|nr:MAG: hypothetical protein M1831_002788 [Alyxoria varia]
MTNTISTSLTIHQPIAQHEQMTHQHNHQDRSRLAPEDAFFARGGATSSASASVATVARKTPERRKPHGHGHHRSKGIRSGSWKKLLWIKHPDYPDNYTDSETFLDHLQRNPRLQPYEFWPLVADSSAIVQQVCTTVIFVCCFSGIIQERVSPVAVVGVGTCATVIGWVLWDRWVGREVEEEEGKKEEEGTGKQEEEQRERRGWRASSQQSQDYDFPERRSYSVASIGDVQDFSSSRNSLAGSSVADADKNNGNGTESQNALALGNTDQVGLGLHTLNSTSTSRPTSQNNSTNSNNSITATNFSDSTTTSPTPSRKTSATHSRNHSASSGSSRWKNTLTLPEASSSHTRGFSMDSTPLSPIEPSLPTTPTSPFPGGELDRAHTSAKHAPATPAVPSPWTIHSSTNQHLRHQTSNSNSNSNNITQPPIPSLIHSNPSNNPPTSPFSPRNQQRLATLKSALLIYCTLLGLSPILKSLTKSTASDSIWAISFWLMCIHVFFFDYSGSNSSSAPGGVAVAAQPSTTTTAAATAAGGGGGGSSGATSAGAAAGSVGATTVSGGSAPGASSGASTTTFPASLSTNAALMASTVLASRLPSTTHVFSLTLFSIEVFGLFPVFRRDLRRASLTGHALLTWGLVVAAGAGVGVCISTPPVASVQHGTQQLGADGLRELVGEAQGVAASRYPSAASLTWTLSRAMLGAVMGSLLTGLGMGICSWWLIGLQRFKNEIHGPWDPARPVIRRRWD